MNAHRHSTLAQLLASGATTGLPVAATAASAHAATAFPHITTAAALTALPGTSELPKGVKLIGKVEAAKSAVDQPCLTKVDAVPLTGSADVAAIYSTAKTSKASPTDSVWTVTEAVFATPSAATAVTGKLVAAQKKCPTTQKQTTDGLTETVTRTVGVADSTEKNTWKGYLTVSHVTASTSSKGARVFETYFERGNIIVKVSEVAPLASSGTAQGKLRKAVVSETLAKLDAVK
jgi:hypothetical protein